MIELKYWVSWIWTNVWVILISTFFAKDSLFELFSFFSSLVEPYSISIVWLYEFIIMVVMDQVWVLHEAQVHTFRSNLHIYHIKPDCPEKNEIMSLIHDFSRNGIYIFRIHFNILWIDHCLPKLFVTIKKADSLDQPILCKVTLVDPFQLNWY